MSTKLTRRHFGQGAFALLVWAVLGLNTAYALPQEEVSEISRMGTAQGRSAEEMRHLIEHAERLESRGLPPEPLLDKIKEGVAKGVPSSRMDPVLTKMSTNLETADGLLKETPGTPQLNPSDRARSLEVLSEALGRGITPDEVRSMRQAGGNTGMRAEQLAYGAKGLALMKEGGVSPEARQSLMSSALRNGVDSPNLLNLGREVKERREFRENPARLRELQGAVDRGESMDKILGQHRGLRDVNPSERKGQDRPGPPQKLERLQRPDRQVRPDRPTGPDRADPPDRGDRSTRQQRLDRPDRPARAEHPERPVRPDLPDRPVRPDLPDRPVRPDLPDRPVRPDLPDHPEPPAHK